MFLNRRGNSALLIPLLAAMALFYPAVGRRTPGPSQGFGSQAESRNASEARSAASGDEEWKGGRNLVRYFLGWPKRQETPPWGADDSRGKTQVEFLIATLPDPVDSGLPHLFDRRLDSIQAALQRAGYLPTGRSRLPWQDCLLGHTKTAAGDGEDGSNAGSEAKKGKGEKKDDKQKACEQQRPFRKEPGVILLQDTNGQDGVHLLLLYLIGETPISGIQKGALRTALEEMAWFCDWHGQEQGKNPKDPLFQTLRAPDTSCGQIRVLGPTFSGSAQSLDFALSSWLNSASRADELQVRMISGSATAIDPDDSFQNIKSFYSGKGKGSEGKKGKDKPGSFTFSSMEAPEAVSSCTILNYLKQVEPDLQRGKVALLSEGGTVYGRQRSEMNEQPNQGGERQEPNGTPHEPKFICNNNTEVTTIKFPLHISQLRAASEAIRESQQETSPQIGAAPEGLPLSKALEEVNQPHDTMAPLSPLDPLTAEQVISQLLSTISRGGYRYVGIAATDARDTMFLAQEVREHCPSTVLFAYDPELLFLHPEVNSSLRGMLLVGSYPLFNTNLLWSPPHPPPGQAHVFMQFPDQGSEGTYNAALALLGADSQMLEYGLPFDEYATRAPLWITVVGRDQLWPLQTHDISGDIKGTSAMHYMYELGSGSRKEEDAEEESQSWFEGAYPTGTTILMAALTVLCIVFCLPLLRRFQTSAGSTPATGSWGGGAWLERALGQAVSETYRRPADLYLLAGCVCMGIFLAVALTTFLIPTIVMFWHEVPVWKTGGSWHWWSLAFSALCLVSVAVLLAASRSLLAAVRSRGQKPESDPDESKNASNLPARGPMVAVVVTLVLFAAFLAGGWLWALWSAQPYSSFFTSLRSLDLLSGLSPLVPLFLIFMAGFLWALSSFRRLRQLEGFESKRGFLSCAAPFWEMGKLEKQVRGHLECPSLRLPGAIVVVVLAECSIGYLFVVRLVNSFEDRPFHWLLGVAFFAVTLALWCGVLRFYCVWQALRRLLHHLHCAPMKAYKRFQSSSPAAYKIDLASPPPTLASLAYSIDQARTVCLRARRLLEAQKVRLKPAVGDETRWASAEIRTQGQEARWSIAELKNRTESGFAAAKELTPDQVVALQRLGSDQMTNLVDDAENYLKDARSADVEGDWRGALTRQVNAQEVVTQVVEKVSLALHDAWWEEVRGPSEKTANPAKSRPEEEVFQLGEDFLVGRVAHFLAYVLPQMQNLIVTSVSGLLLMLFAVSSYPFQPHNLLLFFNWVVILSFVGIAMWVFIQMSRDPVLSSLNGTKAGKINWDWDFVIRILIYGIVPILALLGAQFPQSVGQIVSHFIPSEAGH